MLIHLMTPAAFPGDAITHDLLGMRRWLRRQGHVVRAYAQRRHPALRHVVLPLREYRPHLRSRDDLLLYHHSVGWPAGRYFYERSKNHRLIKYHNVTPAAFFDEYHPDTARMCERGECETRRLVQAGAELFLADSEYNALGLVARGADPSICRALAPFHNLPKRDALPLDEELSAELAGRHNWLFVGRLAPNKGHLHLIRALAHYRRHIRNDATLILVGDYVPGLSSYRFELLSEIRRQGLLHAVKLVGKVSTRQLKTYYRHARVFVCASEHEGFCVPLVEAMYYRVPIVAFGSSAIPSTLGSAGLYWPTPSPALLAESAWQIESRPDVRAALIESQSARFATHFSTEILERGLEEALTPLLAGGAVGV